jgi:hypothetical protein
VAKISPKNGIWTNIELEKAASKYNSRRRFHEGNPAAYRATSRRGITVMNNICSHMEPMAIGRPKKKILTKIAITRFLADNFKIRLMRDLIKNNPDILRSAKFHDNAANNDHFITAIKKAIKMNRTVS